jgi:hypothetical protein
MGVLFEQFIDEILVDYLFESLVLVLQFVHLVDHVNIDFHAVSFHA